MPLGAWLTETVKLEPSVLPLIRSVSPSLVLHVTPSFASRDESCVRNIWLSAVTADVRTVVETASTGIMKLPAVDPQNAGLVLDAHFVSVPNDDMTRGFTPTLMVGQ